MNRPLKVGLTGGIGTGKTTVAKIFETFGIPVLYADDIAKFLMQSDETLIQLLKDAFGSDIYQKTILDRKKLSNIVFKDSKKLAQLNSIVHPAVIKYSQEWMLKQSTPYAIKEAAILIESGSYKDLDKIIGVTAPKEIIIKRVMNRDNVSEDEVLRRMSQQMENEAKMEWCDFVIYNDDTTSLILQCKEIHELLVVSC